MNRFGPLLKRWLSEHNLSLRKLADSSGVPGSDLSRIRAGDLNITQKALIKLLDCELVDRESGRAFLVAYLRDEIPDGWQKAVEVLEHTQNRVSNANASHADPFVLAIRGFEREGELNDTVADFIVAAWAMRTNPQGTDEALEQLKAYRSKSAAVSADRLTDEP